MTGGAIPVNRNAFRHCKSRKHFDSTLLNPQYFMRDHSHFCSQVVDGGSRYRNCFRPEFGTKGERRITKRTQL